MASDALVWPIARAHTSWPSALRALSTAQARRDTCSFDRRTILLHVLARDRPHGCRRSYNAIEDVERDMLV